MPGMTLALAHYDRHVPFFDGSVAVEGVELRVLAVGEAGPERDGSGRHSRMLQQAEFDAAEVSLSSFLMAKERGAAFSAIPVFPRRLFSLSQIWCNRRAGIASPQDLAGRRVGLNSFQTTLSVLAKGDLQRSYGVPWRSIRWMTAQSEVVPFDLPQGASVERAPAGRQLAELLLEGEIDALILPHPPKAVLENRDRVARLFAAPREEEAKYHRTYGYFPIMHLIAFREDVLRASPGLARATTAAFEQAWEACRDHWRDPNWSWLAWGRQDFEAESEALGADAWANGLTPANRTNLEWFIAQSLDQGLIRRPLGLDELFHPSMIDA